VYNPLLLGTSSKGAVWLLSISSPAALILNLPGAASSSASSPTGFPHGENTATAPARILIEKVRHLTADDCAPLIRLAEGNIYIQHVYFSPQNYKTNFLARCHRPLANFFLACLRWLHPDPPRDRSHAGPPQGKHAPLARPDISGPPAHEPAPATSSTLARKAGAPVRLRRRVSAHRRGEAIV